MSGAGKKRIRAARRLLARLLPAGERERLLSELDEFHAAKRARGEAGRIWYWRQVVALALRSRSLRGGAGFIGRGGVGLDAKGALRGLARSPGLTIPAVVILALVIGVNTAVYSVADAVLLAPLPYRDVDRLVHVWQEDPGEGEGATRRASLNAYRAWAASSRSFESMGMWSVWRATLTGLGDPRDVIMSSVSLGFLTEVGMRPVVGRGFQPDDVGTGAPRLILSHATWTTVFGGDPAVVGRTVRLADRPYTVVGVAQPGFRLPLDREVFGWRPFVPEPWENAFADYPDYQVAGWLAPGVDPTAAAGELSSLVPEPAEPQFAGLTVRLARLEELYRPQDGGVLALLGAVSVVLLLGCLNTAQLLVARGVGKSGELAVRMALGSRPGAVGRGHLIEAGLLAGGGTMAGVLLAVLLLRIFVAVDPGHLPGWADVRITTRVVAYLAGVATVATLLAGWLPARLASRISPAASLVPGRGITANRSRGLAQWALLAAQTASAVVVLAGSGLLVRSWLAVQAVDPGIDAARVHAGRVVLPSDRYNPGDGAEHIRFFDALRQRVEADAGVASAAVATSIPMASGLDFDQPFRPEADASARTVDVSTRLISPGYFSTLGIRIVAGRTVEITDDADAERVAIVSEAAARLVFGAAPDDVVGQILIEPSERGDARYRIIGVAADVRDDGLERTPPPKVYLPWQQSRPFGRMWLIVRSDLESPIAFERVKAALREVDAELPLVDATPMTDLVARSVAARRFNLLLLAALGLLALAVATVGVAGLVAFSVSSRRREVGIRVALGASPASVVATTIAPAFGALATGVAAGTVAAGLLTELARGLLFGVEPLDAWSLALACGTLLGAGVVAALACARAAVRSDPLTALNAG